MCITFYKAATVSADFYGKDNWENWSERDFGMQRNVKGAIHYTAGEADRET